MVASKLSAKQRSCYGGNKLKDSHRKKPHKYGIDPIPYVNPKIERYMRNNAKHHRLISALTGSPTGPR